MNIGKQRNNDAIDKINELLELTIEHDESPEINAEDLLFKIEKNFDSVKGKYQWSFRDNVTLEHLSKNTDIIERKNKKIGIDLKFQTDEASEKIVVDVYNKESDDKIGSFSFDVKWDDHTSEAYFNWGDYDEAVHYDAYLARPVLESFEIISGNEKLLDESGIIYSIGDSVFSATDEEGAPSSVSTYLKKNDRRLMDLDSFCESSFKNDNIEYLNLGVLTSPPSRNKIAEPAL